MRYFITNGNQRHELKRGRVEALDRLTMHPRANETIARLEAEALTSGMARYAMPAGEGLRPSGNVLVVEAETHMRTLGIWEERFAAPDGTTEHAYTYLVVHNGLLRAAEMANAGPLWVGIDEPWPEEETEQDDAIHALVERWVESVEREEGWTHDPA